MAQLTSSAFITRTTAGIAIVGTTGGAGGAGAGSSAVDGLCCGTVDMVGGYDGVLFIQTVIQGGTGGAISYSVRASSAALTANTSAGQGVALSGTTSTIAAGSSATLETFVVDLYRPRQYSTVALGGRFLFGQISVASSCSFIGPGFALQYRSRGSSLSTAGSTLTSVPQSTGASTGSPFITGGVVRAVSPSS